MMQRAFIIIRSRNCSSVLFEAPGQTAHAFCGGAETLDFAIVYVKGIQQILPTATLKPANVNLLSNWRAINFLTTSKLGGENDIVIYVNNTFS